MQAVMKLAPGVGNVALRDIAVPERNVHRLPDNVDDLSGALTEPLACVVHGALELAAPLPGDTVVVAGPGAIGLLTAQVLKAAGARVVLLGTDADEQRLALARDALGVAHTINVQRTDPLPAVLDLSDGLGADAVYECSGAGPAAAQLLTLVRRAGRYAQIGLFGKPIVWDLDQVCYKELAVNRGASRPVCPAWYSGCLGAYPEPLKVFAVVLQPSAGKPYRGWQQRA